MKWGEEEKNTPLQACPLSPRERSSRQGSCRVGAGHCGVTPVLLVACSGESNSTICDHRVNRTAVTMTSSATKIPSIQPAQLYRTKLCCSTYSTIGVCIVCSSTADFSTCKTGAVRVTKNPHKYRGNNRQVDKEKQLSHGKVTYSSKTGLLRVSGWMEFYISYLLL